MLSTVMRDLTFAYLRCASVSSSPRIHCDRCANHWDHHSDLELGRCRPLAATSIPGIRSVSSDRYSSVLPGLHQLISTNLAAANNLGTSYPNFFDWQQQNKVQCFRRSDDVWPHCCCSVAAMNFLAYVDAVIFRSARKWRGRPEDGRDDLKLSHRQTDSSQRLIQSKRGLHDSGPCPMFPERWRINPHSC
jgi:hypothetical protein